MTLYDADIQEILERFHCTDNLSLNIEEGYKKPLQMPWSVSNEEELVLRGEMAFELGGDGHYAISGMAYTLDKTLLPKGGVFVIGPELVEMNTDQSYARITLIRLSEHLEETKDDALYQALRKIDYVRYHVHPQGFMMRISSVQEREPVRVSKKSLADGMSLESIGEAFRMAYEAQPNVEAAAIIFVTDPQEDYAAIEKQMKRLNGITDSLNHIYENLKMDCSVCSLKPICDEVDGLRMLHQKQSQKINYMGGI